jgi:hypothetical protein
MSNRRRPDLQAVRDSVALVGRLSDSLVRLGPFSIGIDGVLSWIPGLGEIYGVAAGGFMLIQGARAGVPLPTLAICLLLMGLRTVADTVPIAGAVFSDIFTAHKWSARMIVAAIDRKLAAGGQVVDAESWSVRPTIG